MYSGRHVLVRPLAPNDIPLLHLWLQSPVFAAYNPNLIGLRADALATRLSIFAQLEPPPEIQVIVEHRATGTPIGMMSLASIDRRNAKAEFAVGFVRAAATRCALEAVHFGLERAFDDLELHKLVFFVAPENQAARRLIDRCAFAPEGRLREELRGPDGQRHDLLRYALLRSEWQTGELRRRLQRTAALAP